MGVMDDDTETFCRECQAVFANEEFEYRFPILFHGEHDAEQSGYAAARLRRIRQRG